jgi:hypothetical protein
MEYKIVGDGCRHQVRCSRAKSFTPRWGDAVHGPGTTPARMLAADEGLMRKFW